MDIIFFSDIFINIKRLLIPKDLYNLMLTCKYYIKNSLKNDFKSIIINEINRRLRLIFKDDFDEFKKAMQESNAVIVGSFITQCILDERWEYSDISICVPITPYKNDIPSNKKIFTTTNDDLFLINKGFENINMSDSELQDECDFLKERKNDLRKYNKINLTDSTMYINQEIELSSSDSNDYPSPKRINDRCKLSFFLNENYSGFWNFFDDHRMIENKISYKVQNTDIQLIYTYAENIKKYISNGNLYNVCKNTYQYKNTCTKLSDLYVHNITEVLNRHINLENVRFEQRFRKYHDRGFSFYVIIDNDKKILSNKEIHDALCKSVILFVKSIPVENKSMYDHITTNDNKICRICQYIREPIYEIYNYTFPDGYRMHICSNNPIHCITCFLYPGLTHMFNNSNIFIISTKHKFDYTIKFIF